LDVRFQIILKAYFIFVPRLNVTLTSRGTNLTARFQMNRFWASRSVCVLLHVFSEWRWWRTDYKQAVSQVPLLLITTLNWN